MKIKILIITALVWIAIVGLTGFVENARNQFVEYHMTHTAK